MTGMIFNPPTSQPAIEPTPVGHKLFLFKRSNSYRYADNYSHLFDDISLLVFRPEMTLRTSILVANIDIACYGNCTWCHAHRTIQNGKVRHLPLNGTIIEIRIDENGNCVPNARSAEALTARHTRHWRLNEFEKSLVFGWLRCCASADRGRRWTKNAQCLGLVCRWSVWLLMLLLVDVGAVAGW